MAATAVDALAQSATGTDSTATGTGSVASGVNSTANGVNSTASGMNATAIGQGATALGTDSTALGQDSRAANDYTVSIGRGSRATGYGSVAHGGSSQSSGFLSTAVGTDSVASGDFSAAVGQSSRATGFMSISLGQGSTATNDRSTATGSASGSFSTDSSAFGSGASAGGDGSTTFSNVNSTAVGAGAEAGSTGSNQANATAVGQGSAANADKATALGQGAIATAAESVAIGQGSIADVSNTVSVGSSGKERRVLNVAAGTLDVNGTDAVNASQLYTTNQNVDTLDGRLTANEVGLVSIDDRITTTESSITTLDGRATGVEGRVNGVEGQIGGIEGRVGTAESDITSLAVRATSVEGRIVSAEGQFGTIDSRFSTAESDILALQGQVFSGASNLVQQATSNDNLTIGASTGGGLIDVTGISGSRRLTGIGGGLIAATSTDAVNGAQLFSTEDRIARAFDRIDTSDTLIADLDTQIEALATAAHFASGSGLIFQQSTTDSIGVGSVVGGTRVNFVGNDGARVLAGVSDGVVEVASSDAINGSQFYRGQASVASALGGRARVAANGEILGAAYRVGGIEVSDVASAIGSLDTAVAGLRQDIAGLSNGAGKTGYLSVRSLRSDSDAEGLEATAIGGGANASGENSTAVGSDAQASASGATAYGAETRALQNDTTSIGFGATALHARSSAFGAGSSTTRDNQIALGTNSSTYTMPGINSDVSRSAQSGDVRLVTSDAQGNLATSDLSSFFPGIEGFEGKLQEHESQLEKHSDGIAIAIAMGGNYLAADKNYSLSGNVGVFDGNMAMSFSGIGRVSENILLNAGVGLGFEQTTIAGRAGLTFAW